MNRREFLGASALTISSAYYMGIVAGPVFAESKDKANSIKNAKVTYFDARPGARSRDVGFDSDGMVWYCGQADGTLTRLDPDTGELHPVSLGEKAAPHGVVLGPDNAMWVTEGGQNAIARVDPATDAVTLIPLPAEFEDANLNTGVFDHDGIYWFTGQNGVYGRVDPVTQEIEVWPSPQGPGPYGITVTPQGDVWYASLAGSHIANIDRANGRARIVTPPTEEQGARRVWSNSEGKLWVSEWLSGQVSEYDPQADTWREWRLPGNDPLPYSVYVDENDKVWLTDFDADAVVYFDPDTEEFTSFPSNKTDPDVRQMAGRKGEVWGGESGTDRIVRIQFEETETTPS
ncbi:virginiamycin B lyase [Pseudovibrio denitrificans]|uniref:Virginiamycin B lyase n=1 Tax=Pseudovibrio denitrificans TaxID=258256 RepID=A0A1I7DWF0_9HYPH|nr:hypothetical protein [Pseudovibrio denitrificans]SFU15989.1 virginiamycin B lyase [Pseudovibrio denitrificans]